MSACHAGLKSVELIEFASGFKLKLVITASTVYIVYTNVYIKVL